MPANKDSVIQKAGVALFVIGMVLLTGFGFVQGLLEKETPVWARIGLGALLCGLLIIIVSLAFQKWNENDEYEEIER